MAESEFEVSSDPARIDIDWIHDRLSTDTYWAPGRPKERVAKQVAHSHCYGVYGPEGGQVGFARLVTDFTIVAWLGDVYIDPAYRGRGLSTALLDRIMADVREWKLRRILLSTADADGLYRRYGFDEMSKDEDAWLQVVWEHNP